MSNDNIFKTVDNVVDNLADVVKESKKGKFKLTEVLSLAKLDIIKEACKEGLNHVANGINIVYEDIKKAYNEEKTKEERIRENIIDIKTTEKEIEYLKEQLRKEEELFKLICELKLK